VIRAEAPAGAQVFDLEAARAARQEARTAAGDSGALIKLAAGFIDVKSEFPITVGDLFKTGDIKGGLAELLVDPADVDELIKAGITSGDLAAITEFISGATLGELSASAKS
jgi:hypothetical protein